MTSSAAATRPSEEKTGHATNEEGQGRFCRAKKRQSRAGERWRALFVIRARALAVAPCRTSPVSPPPAAHGQATLRASECQHVQKPKGRGSGKAWLRFAVSGCCLARNGISAHESAADCRSGGSDALAQATPPPLRRGPATTSTNRIQISYKF